MDTDYEEDFDFSENEGIQLDTSASKGPPPQPWDSTARVKTTFSDSEPSTDEHSTLFEKVSDPAGNSDFSVGESWPPRNDAIQQSKGLTILPPLERPVSDGFDEDEEKQSTLKATAKQQGLLSAPSVNTLDSLSFMGDTIKGSVQLLGTKKQVTADEQDLAFDVDLPDDLDSRLKSGTIKPRASFESHISVEGEELSGLPCSSSIKRPSSATSSRASARLPRDSLSSQAESADECVEDGFDIPHDLASLSLSPKRPRNQHARISSASSTCTTHNLLSDEPSQSRSRVRTLSSTSGHSARSGEHSSTSMLLRPSHSQHRVKKSKSSVTTIQSPSSASHSAASADEVEVDFFQDIDLPDFFGTATGNQSSSPLSGVAPPASLPARPDTSGKCPGSVDLQSMLNAKLSERLRRSEAEEVSLPFSPTSQQQLPQSRRRRHREKPAEQFEDGLIVEEGSFLRKPPRGGSLDSWALFQQNPSAAPSNHGRGESANAIMQPGGTSSSILGRKGLVHSKSFIKALSDAHAQTLPGGRVSVPQPNLPSAQQASSSRSLSTTSRPTLNRKRSTPQLQPKPNSADIVRQSTTPYSSSNADSSRQRTLSLPRKTSMPLLSAASSRSSTPSLSHYAQPTQGSRLKHLANDASRTITASPVIPSTRPNTPAAPGAAVRLTLPTLSSKAKQKQKSSPLQSSYEANPSRCASDPTGSTSSILFPSGSATVNRSSLGSVNILRKPKKGVIYGEGTELDAFDDLPANKEKERRFQSISRGRPVESTAPSLRKPVSRHASRPKKSDKGKRRERAQPQLIRNLGPAHAAKVQGDMVWDAKNMKWQGNAQALQAFDHVLSSSARPALISPGMAKPRTSAGLTAGLGGVRVVGDMVFDPVLMSWHHLDAQGEEELDFGDDEADIPSVNFGSSQDAIKLSSKASFHSQDGDSACSQSGKNEFIEACHTAQTRHEQEMKSFPANVKERDDRNYLWKIRKIVMQGSL